MLYVNKMTINQKIGGNLKAARIQKGFTQSEMAKKMGILQPAYARYESGKIQLNYEQVEELCNYLEITPSYLWGFED